MMTSHMLTIASVVSLVSTSTAQTLPLPAQTAGSVSAVGFIRQIESSSLEEREVAIASEVLKGNIPTDLRQLFPINITNITGGNTDVATIFVARDYLAIGTSENHFYTPMTPATAQRIADQLDCTIPTRKMVDAIYAAAEIKLKPQPIPPSQTMTTVPVFATHSGMIREQVAALGKSPSTFSLIAGHKKDVVISAELRDHTNRVAIYGWHQSNSSPIQPLYTGHRADWVDYSHGIRLVSQHMILNGEATTVTKTLADPLHSGLLSDEGVITQPRYSLGTNGSPSTIAVDRTNSLGERITSFSPASEVKVEINSPRLEDFSPTRPVTLILFALPNGNSTAQTVGKKLLPGDDWHYDIQHIGAQTRFIRAADIHHTFVIAYLETEMKSWPAWRKKYGDKTIPEMVAAIKARIPTNKLELVLTGHSGGGSFTFGYINALGQIPDDVKRIAFLDSNYAYETTNHLSKILSWLNRSSDNNLCTFAYHDSIALLNGKTFVSERGGTWGRSHAMLEDLKQQFPFASSTNDFGLETHTALGGRIRFVLKQNPEKKILHTVQVERNGFIHAMLTDTPLENHDYDYFGERAYSKWILAD